jgi:hypothetical protein
MPMFLVNSKRVVGPFCMTMIVLPRQSQSKHSQLLLSWPRACLWYYRRVSLKTQKENNYAVSSFCSGRKDHQCPGGVRPGAKKRLLLQPSFAKAGSGRRADELQKRRFVPSLPACLPACLPLRPYLSHKRTPRFSLVGGGWHPTRPHRIRNGSAFLSHLYIKTVILPRQARDRGVR